MSNSEWDATFYDKKHSYVSNYGFFLFEWFPKPKNKTVYDLGCGTGDLTKKIYQLGFDVKGIDRSASMIVEAKKKYPEINFLVQDVLEMDYKEKTDIVFSNAVFHWIKETKKLSSSIYNLLKPSGELICEFGGENNIKNILTGINNALDHFGYSKNKDKNPWNFISMKYFSSILERNGFIVRKVEYFDRFTQLDDKEKGLENWIKMFCFFFFEGVPNKVFQEMISFIEEKTRENLYKGGSWYADYKRLRIKAEKL